MATGPDGPGVAETDIYAKKAPFASSHFHYLLLDTCQILRTKEE